MEIEEMLAQADYLMHIADSKCDSWVDAQETLYRKQYWTDYML